MKNKSFAQSVKNAWKGFVTAFREERNIRTDVVFTLLVIAGAVFFNTTFLERVVALGACALVISSELVNSAIERVVDLYGKIDSLAGAAKDMSSAATLVLAAFALAAGLYIYVPYIWRFVAEVLK